MHSVIQVINDIEFRIAWVSRDEPALYIAGVEGSCQSREEIQRMFRPMPGWIKLSSVCTDNGFKVMTEVATHLHKFSSMFLEI